VSLVGDAAHLMLPNGEGVNAAMLDSLLLSKAVIKAYETAGKDADSFLDTFDQPLKEYEVALVERAKDIGKDTDMLIGTMFGTDDAGHELAGLFQSAGQQQPEYQ
jgi:2-polyprenyl-6-methoxyphenol hydroxylase-like FAD-dependent oxidoreductase